MPEPTDPLDVLGQMLVAFGAGAGCIRVSREVVATHRARYWPAIERNLGTWEDDAVQVLERSRTHGRLAAQLATSDGASAIGVPHFLSAAARVEGPTSWCGATSPTPRREE